MCPVRDDDCRSEASRPLLVRSLAVAWVVVLLAAGNASARLGAWTDSGCEPPSVFYSVGHDPTKASCCANVTLPSVGVCPGGDVCPADGHCVIGTCKPNVAGSLCPKGNACPPDGRCLGSCVPATDAMNALPNIVVITSDDQAYCHYGFEGYCRSDVFGTPVPAPYTPTLDALGTRGKVFPVAHNSAHWCFPSLDTIITGRLPPHSNCTAAACRPPGARMNGEAVGSATAPSIPQLLSAAGPGYCSYQVGKGSDKGFDANRRSRSIGRTPCARCGKRSWDQIDPAQCQFDPAACPDPEDPNNPACATAPHCGEDIVDILSRRGAPATGDINDFFHDMVAKGQDGKSYLPKKLFLWYAPHLPHRPVAPDDVIEHRPHLPDPTGPMGSDYCKDFLFGFRCDAGGPGGAARVLGPRFPFGDPAFASTFRGTEMRSSMQGLYGNIYWLDTSVQRIRRFLDSYSVETPTGPARLSANTVFLYLSDNGTFLPRSKKHFTENGFRTALIVYDPRHETPPGGKYMVEQDIAHGVDVLPTVLSYAGVGKPAAALGKDLRPWIESSSPQPLRNAVCGTDIQGSDGNGARYLLPRAGRVGQCSVPTGASCSADSDCNVALGQLCTASGACVTPGAKACVDSDDCRATPNDPQVCELQQRKWCSNSPLQRCSSDNECRTGACKVCSQALSKTCTSNAECGNGQWGTCIDAPGSKLACRCDYRMVKLYQTENGAVQRITDLLHDPDETALVDGTAASSATGDSSKLAHRLRCCMDKWWLPTTITHAACPGSNQGCDARIDCSL